MSLNPCGTHSELCGIWDFHKSELSLLVVGGKEAASLMLWPGAAPPSGEQQDHGGCQSCLSSWEAAEEFLDELLALEHGDSGRHVVRSC